MNGLEKPFRKKSYPNNRKKLKIKVKLPHVKKKTASEKALFPLVFRSTSCFGVTKMTSKIIKMCEDKMCEQNRRRAPK